MSDLNDRIALVCDLCAGIGWLPSEHEKGVGWVDVRCPKCNWWPWVQSPIPAPVDALAFVSDRKRIALGEDEAWRQHAKAQT